jgi:hypothetical protein
LVKGDNMEESNGESKKAFEKKVERVIHSCKTQEQLDVAVVYVKRAKIKIKKSIENLTTYGFWWGMLMEKAWTFADKRKEEKKNEKLDKDNKI